MQGYLDKKGDKGPLKLWRQRWFAEDAIHSRIAYSVDPESAAKGHIALPVDRVYEGDGLLMGVIVGPRTYLLRAPDAEARNRWLRAFVARDSDTSPPVAKSPRSKKRSSVDMIVITPNASAKTGVRPDYYEIKLLVEKQSGNVAFCPGSSLGALIHHGQLCRQDSNYQEAAFTLRLAVSYLLQDDADQRPPFDDFIQLIFMLGDSLRKCEKSKEALHYFQIAQRLLANAHLDFLYSVDLNHIGGCLRDAKDYAGALKLYHQAQDLQLKLLASMDDLDGATTTNKNQGDIAVTRSPPNVEATEIATAYASTINNIAMMHFHLGQLNDAKLQGQKALAFLEKLCGTENPNYIGTLGSLAQVAFSEKDYDTAERQYRTVLQKWGETMGTTHLTYALYQVDLAGVLIAKGDTSGARSCYVESLLIFNMRVGPNHHYTVQTQQMLDALS